MRVHLGYGQDRPDDSALDIGLDGPTLSGIDSIESTYYATTITMHFRDAKSFDTARLATGWTPYSDSELILEVETIGPFVVTREPKHQRAPMYYANLFLVEDASILAHARDQLADVAHLLDRARESME